MACQVTLQSGTGRRGRGNLLAAETLKFVRRMALGPLIGESGRPLQCSNWRQFQAGFQVRETVFEEQGGMLPCSYTPA